MSSTERSAVLLSALLAMAATTRGALAGVPDARLIVDDPAYQRDHPADSPNGPSVCPLNGDGAPSSCSGGDDGAAGPKPGDSRKPGEGTKPGGDSSKPGGKGDPKPGGSGDTKPGGNGDPKPGGNGDAKPGGNGDAKPGSDGDSSPGGGGGAIPGGAKSGDGAQPADVDAGAGAQPGTARRPRDPSAGREPRTPRTPPASEPDDLAAAGETADILGRVLMVMLGAGLVALLVMGAGWLFSRRRPAPAAATPAELEAAPAAARPVDPTEAETMAHEGRYADAVRVLLQASLARLAAVGRSVVATDTTSREALARAALDDSARSALYELVLAVEASLFGGAEIGRDEYVRCSASYRRLIDALGAQRADALGAQPGARVGAHQ